MKKILFISVMLLTAACNSRSCQTGNDPVRIIFDTDMGPDYDDVGAMAMLHALTDKGEAEILATVSSNKNEFTVPCIDVINTYFGRPDLPVGAPKGVAPDLTTWHGGLKWPEDLPARYPHKIEKTSDAEDAVSVYRRVLSSQPDGSVTIVTVGFLSNLRDLLKSGPDQYSKLDGYELVKSKVKELVSMAGINSPEMREFNVVMDPDAGHYVFTNWPGRITISGWDIGVKVITGKQTAAMETSGSPIKDAYEIALAQDDPQGRMSWDQTAVLVAVRGPGGYYSTEQGTLTVDPSGLDTWTSGQGSHYKLVEKMAPSEVAVEIEKLMMYLPH